MMLENMKYYFKVFKNKVSSILREIIYSIRVAIYQFMSFFKFVNNVLLCIGICMFIILLLQKFNIANNINVKINNAIFLVIGSVLYFIVMAVINPNEFEQ